MNRFSLLLLLLFAIIANKSFSQNTFPSTGSAGIGTTSPNASSLLEVKSTTKGVLLPRMTKTQRDAIASPVQGLMIYQTNSTPGLYYYDGGWSAVAPKSANKTLNNLTAPTAVNIDLLPATNNTISFGSSSLGWKNIYAAGSYYIGTNKVLDLTGTGNTFLGNLGNTTNTGTYNTFIGNSAGKSNTSGSYSVAVGYQAMYLNTTGSWNTATGNAALYSNTTGYENTADGLWALYSNTTGYSNTANGEGALYSNTTGFENTANGSGALGVNSTGIRNTAIGEESLYNNSADNNSAIGFETLYLNLTGTFNTASGGWALAGNTTGSYNTANGCQSLYSNNGNYNSAFGVYGLYTNTSGSENTSAGFSALKLNTTGSFNSATGKDALYSNTTGSENTADGHGSMFYNTTGAYNSAVGRNSLHDNNDGIGNTATGHSSLISNISGDYNTADGYLALSTNTSGSYNTALGYYADVTSGGFTEATAIGAYAFPDASYKVRIGSNIVSSIGGQVSWSTFSDGRFKKEIKEDVKGLEFINRLRPVSYTVDIASLDNYYSSFTKNYQPDKNQSSTSAKRQYGFIAQEVEKAAGEIGFTFSGVDKPTNDKALYGLRYSDFVVPLVKAVQELDSENRNLKKENSEMRSANDAQQKQIDELKSSFEQLQSSIEKIVTPSGVEGQESSITDGYAKLQTLNSKPETLLGQNIPNPFDNSTLIPFRIPKNCSDASIMITNTETSEVISVIPISCNEDHVSIDAGTLSSGTYIYTLYVNGKMIDAKSMVLTK